MKLENIGFYTLSDERARNASVDSILYRGEIILHDKCNFKCPYCRGVDNKYKKTLSLEGVKKIIDLWSPIKNIRFSGGEPTLHKNILAIVKYAKHRNIKNIAVSTNGFSEFELYQKLIDAGVNDFSISLDSCCSSSGKAMCGGINGAWEKVVKNIREIAKQVYVTVGMVFVENKNVAKSILFAESLGVSDIRVVSSAQENFLLEVEIPENILAKYLILKYRINNYRNGRNVRGLCDSDNNKCPLVLDDSAIVGDYHFPCIIYLRERGKPIGKVGKNMRKEREKWYNDTDQHKDPICRKNCLDVCRDYNNKYCELRQEKT